MSRRSSTKEARETQAAIEELRQMNEAGFRMPGAPPPGDAPGNFDTSWWNGGSGRLHGRFATATWAGLTLLLFDWEVSVEQEFADGTAHGEYWDNPVPLKQMWTGTARTYMTTEPPSAAYPAAGWLTWGGTHSLIYSGSRAGGDPAAAAFAGYNRGAVGNFLIFSGSAYVSRANFQAPRGGMATQEVVIRGIGAPTAGAQV